MGVYILFVLDGNGEVNRMTIEDYNTASDIITKIQTLDDSIYAIENILQTSDVTEWLMEIRPNRLHTLKEIDHEGLLPEFLNMALSKLCEEREELKKKLEAI